jgi:hypothetical protein
MGLQAAVHLGHMPWALMKEKEEEARVVLHQGVDCKLFLFNIFAEHPTSSSKPKIFTEYRYLSW